MLFQSDSDHDVTGELDDNETNNDVKHKESSTSEVMMNSEIPEKKLKMDVREESMEIKNENN